MVLLGHLFYLLFFIGCLRNYFIFSEHFHKSIFTLIYQIICYSLTVDIQCELNNSYVAFTQAFFETSRRPFSWFFRIVNAQQFRFPGSISP